MSFTQEGFGNDVELNNIDRGRPTCYSSSTNVTCTEKILLLKLGPLGPQILQSHGL
jgi:hypothetical protein